MKFTPGEINIICSDVEESLRFYRDVLGFEPTEDSEGFYHLRCGTRQYLLLPFAHRSESQPDYGTVPQFSMDLHVDDLSAANRYFQGHGVTFAQEWNGSAPMFVIRDPDGLPWEIIGPEE